MALASAYLRRTVNERFIPKIRLVHPHPRHRFDVRTQWRSPVALVAPTGICAGVPGNRYSYRDRMFEVPTIQLK